MFTKTMFVGIFVETTSCCEAIFDSENFLKSFQTKFAAFSVFLNKYQFALKRNWWKLIYENFMPRKLQKNVNLLINKMQIYCISKNFSHNGDIPSHWNIIEIEKPIEQTVSILFWYIAIRLYDSIAVQLRPLYDPKVKYINNILTTS